MSDEPKPKRKAKRKTSPRKALAMAGRFVVARGIAPAELAAQLSARYPRRRVAVYPAELGGAVVSVAELGGRGRVELEDAAPAAESFGRLAAVEYVRGGKTYRHEYTRGPQLVRVGSHVITPPLKARGEELS